MSELDNIRAEVESLKVNVNQLLLIVSDHEQRFDTLQTSLWKRLVFRADGWPGQNNLNAVSPAWRPWRRWYKS